MSTRKRRHSQISTPKETLSIIAETFVPAVIDKPEVFVGHSSSELQKSVRTTLKELYDYAKTQLNGRKMGLAALIVDGFDADQIWEEIQLRNEPLFRYVEKEVDVLINQDFDIVDNIRDLEDFEHVDKKIAS